MSWTDERIDTLRKMWEAGQTASQIAEELGGVSRNAVIGKAHRLGLQSRPSPVKPNEPAAAAAPKAAAPPDAARAELAAANPQGRLITPDEVASAIVWLCLPENQGANGAILPIAGGEV